MFDIKFQIDIHILVSMLHSLSTSSMISTVNALLWLWLLRHKSATKSNLRPVLSWQSVFRIMKPAAFWETHLHLTLVLHTVSHRQSAIQMFSGSSKCCTRVTFLSNVASFIQENNGAKSENKWQLSCCEVTQWAQLDPVHDSRWLYGDSPTQI